MKRTVGLAVAAAVLFLLAWVGLKSGHLGFGTGMNLRRDGFVFDTAQVSEVTGLTVIYGMDTAVLERQQGIWVTVRDGEPVDAERLQRALHGLLGIRSDELVSESKDPARLEEFGIGPVEAKQVEWILASGKTAHILLGKTSGTDFNSTYWKWPDKPGVYRTPGDFTFDLAAQVDAWKVDGPAPAFKVQ